MNGKQTVKEKPARDISAAPGLLVGEVRALLVMAEEMPGGKALCHLDFRPDRGRRKQGRKQR